MHCKKCGASVEQGSKFCAGCGQPVGDSPSQGKSNSILIIGIVAGLAVGIVGLVAVGFMMLRAGGTAAEVVTSETVAERANIEEISAEVDEAEATTEGTVPGTARINITNIETSAYPTTSIKFTVFNADGSPVMELGKQYLSVKVNNQYAEVIELTQLTGNEFSAKVNSPAKDPGTYDFEVHIAAADYEGKAFANATVNAPSAAPAPAPARTAANNYYIFPRSSSAYLSAGELSNQSLETLQLARNEIYARHGHVFTNANYARYFSNQAWYVADPSYKSGDAALNQYEKYNVKLIQDYEKLYEKAPAAPAARAVSNNYYIFPQSASAYLTDRDLAGKSLSELQLGRNEIYARHGYIFSKAEFSKHFNNQAWYSPNSSYKGGDSTLNQYEKANIKLIQEYEDRY